MPLKMTRLRLMFVRMSLASAIAIVAVAPSSSQAPTSPFDPIVEVLRQELQDTRTPGAAIALVEGERMVFATSMGVADVETGAPVRPEMLFRLGSTTKMFTATALVTLAEEGKVALDAPIGAVLTGLDPAIARLTPNLLLSHTAGLRDDAVMFGRHDDDALAAGIRAMNKTAFFTDPGAIYSYANPGFWIAGLVVEHIAGKPYADAMVERVFTPLGMTRSTFRPTMAMTFPLSQGHDASPAKVPSVIRPAADNVANWPAGSMFSTVHDLSRFVIAFMNEGRIDGRTALSPRVITTISTPHASVPGGDSSYGYGLTLTERHGGATRGARWIAIGIRVDHHDGAGPACRRHRPREQDGIGTAEDCRARAGTPPRRARGQFGRLIGAWEWGHEWHGREPVGWPLQSGRRFSARDRYDGWTPGVSGRTARASRRAIGGSAADGGQCRGRSTHDLGARAGS